VEEWGVGGGGVRRGKELRRAIVWERERELEFFFFIVYISERVLFFFFFF
jgi:hypothetical protein